MSAKTYTFGPTDLEVSAIPRPAMASPPPEILIVNVAACEVCSAPGSLRVDPYDIEVNEEIRERVLCDGCFEERRDSV